jgi:hypothetical protein
VFPGSAVKSSAISIDHILVKHKGCACYVRYEPVTGNWSIRDKKHLGFRNTNAEVKYGLERYNALYIIEATLNLREIKLFDNGNEYNERDTLQSTDNTYAEKLANREKEAEELRELIAMREDCA